MVALYWRSILALQDIITIINIISMTANIPKTDRKDRSREIVAEDIFRYDEITSNQSDLVDQLGKSVE